MAKSPALSAIDALVIVDDSLAVLVEVDGFVATMFNADVTAFAVVTVYFRLRSSVQFQLAGYTGATHTQVLQRAAKAGLFGKNTPNAPVVDYIENMEKSCFICGRMDDMFVRYVDTIFHMWKRDSEFRDKFATSKGFCTYHYGILYKKGQNKLSKEQYAQFIEILNKVYFDNMERVNGDLSWFIDKFDYRYKNEPWKNSKDALPRGIIKIGHTFVE